MAHSVLKSAKIVPEEVDRLKEIGGLKEQIKLCANENKKKSPIKILNGKTLDFNLIIEKNTLKK